MHPNAENKPYAPRRVIPAERRDYNHRRWLKIRDTVRKQKELRKKRGLCTACGKKMDRVGALCRACCGVCTRINRGRLLYREKHGMCRSCGKRPRNKNRQSCTQCLLRDTNGVRATLARLRKIVYKAYGDKCACCGEKIWQFLTLHHVNGDGARHRKELRGRKRGLATNVIYRWIIQNNFPKTLQLACYNCNSGAFRNGGICPHQERREKYAPKRGE
jgi:hypothetical protein